MENPSRICLETLESNLGYTFKSKKILEEALTHPSVAHRHVIRNYERLEFLGDRVLGLVVAHLLYTRFPDDLEGDLAKRFAWLVSRPVLIQVARRLGLESYVLLGKGVSNYSEERRQSLLADACEALTGALYMDGGLDVARFFVEREWMTHLEGMKGVPKDAKSSLQEWAQGRGGIPPEYVLIGREGPDHAPVFTVEVRVSGLEPRQGKASSRRQAEQLAAGLILKELKK